jgi:hypothetical protein
MSRHLIKHLKMNLRQPIHQTDSTKKDAVR